MTVILRPFIAAAMAMLPGCSTPVDKGAEPMSNITETAGVADTVDTRASAIADRIGLRLPATAKAEFAERFAGQDDAARLVLVMPDADWAGLRATLPLSAPDQPPLSADANFHLGPDRGDWAPSRSAGLQTVQLPWRDGVESLNLGVAPADPGQTRVFVFWHQL